MVRTVGVPGGEVAGETLTHDGRYLLVAGGPSAYVLSVQRAEQGIPRAILGRLTIPNEVLVRPAIEVITSPDDRFAFLSIEFSDQIAVFDLHSALVHQFRTSAFVGTIPLGVGVVGMAISPNGKWLYATSKQASGSQGSLNVINLRRGETDPTNAVRASVSAGCDPVRVAASPDGQTVWVTARESNALLGFSSDRLLNDPSRALSADVRVGQAPVGLAVVNNGRQIVVANSNRFMAKHSRASLTIVNTTAALHGTPAIAGSLPTGLFPREESLAPNGTLLISDSDSNQLQAVNTGELP